MDAPDWDGLYFTRCAVWDWNGPDTVRILDRAGRTVLTLNRRETFSFHGADSASTIGRFLSDSLGRTYLDGPAPASLRQLLYPDLVHMVRDLKVIRLWRVEPSLPSYFEMPRSQWDKAEVAREMREDGFAEIWGRGGWNRPDDAA